MCSGDAHRDALLNKDQQHGLVVERQDGSRRITAVVELDGPAAKAA